MALSASDPIKNIPPFMNVFRLNRTMPVAGYISTRFDLFLPADRVALSVWFLFSRAFARFRTCPIRWRVDTTPFLARFGWPEAFQKLQG
jgi:hypothetical protein